MQFSIRSVMVFGFCGLLGSSVALVILIGLFGTLGNTLTLIARDAKQVIDGAEQRLLGELHPIEQQARFIAEMVELGRLDLADSERAGLVLETAMGTLPDLAGILLLDKEGFGHRTTDTQLATGESRTESGDFSADYLILDSIELAKGKTQSVWLEPAWIPEFQETYINYHTPLYHGGEFVGLLIQAKAVSDLSRSLQGFGTEEGRVPFLLYDGKSVLAHPGLAERSLDASVGEPLPPIATFWDAILQGFPELEGAASQHFLEDGETQLGNYDDGEEDYFFSYRALTGVAADKSVTVGVYQNVDTYSSIAIRTTVMIVVGVFVFLLSGFLALKLAQMTSQPITALADAFRRVRDGDLQDMPALPTSHLKELNEASQSFEGMVQGLRERERILDLFGRVVPAKVAERMLKSPSDLAPQKTEATVLFCDLAGFTQMTEELGAERLVGVLNAYFTDMVDIVHQHDGIVTQFQGDAVLAVFNLPVADEAHIDKAIQAACDMEQHLRTRIYEGQRLHSRVGVATGPLIAANVGAESRMNYTVHGDTVNLASRLEAMNKELGTTVLIAESSVKESALGPFQEKGNISVRGQSQPVRVYTLGEECA